MAVRRQPENGTLPLFHGGNRGSNPLGDANKINYFDLTPSVFPKISQKATVGRLRTVAWYDVGWRG
jgi:hypothetical protein